MIREVSDDSGVIVEVLDIHLNSCWQSKNIDELMNMLTCRLDITSWRYGCKMLMRVC